MINKLYSVEDEPSHSKTLNVHSVAAASLHVRTDNRIKKYSFYHNTNHIP